eukprot:6168005-Karenia_brevis.AAC.1
MLFSLEERESRSTEALARESQMGHSKQQSHWDMHSTRLRPLKAVHWHQSALMSGFWMTVNSSPGRAKWTASCGALIFFSTRRGRREARRPNMVRSKAQSASSARKAKRLQYKDGKRTTSVKRAI